jgi:hypothetical protein
MRVMIKAVAPPALVEREPAAMIDEVSGGELPKMLMLLNFAPCYRRRGEVESRSDS